MCSIRSFYKLDCTYIISSDPYNDLRAWELLTPRPVREEEEQSLQHQFPTLSPELGPPDISQDNSRQTLLPKQVCCSHLFWGSAVPLCCAECHFSRLSCSIDLQEAMDECTPTSLVE
jgi:hypothetical protein